eukprot:111831-Chlamydomonas_euryale.AAC.2
MQRSCRHSCAAGACWAGAALARSAISAPPYLTFPSRLHSCLRAMSGRARSHIRRRVHACTHWVRRPMHAHMLSW